MGLARLPFLGGKIYFRNARCKPYRHTQLS
jgi:hypothetical protein